jgi:hypothetical protein
MSATYWMRPHGQDSCCLRADGASGPHQPHGLGQEALGDRAQIGGGGEVAVLEQLALAEAGPVGADPAPVNSVTGHEGDCGGAVIRALWCRSRARCGRTRTWPERPSAPEGKVWPINVLVPGSMTRNASSPSAVLVAGAAKAGSGPSSWAASQEAGSAGSVSVPRCPIRNG